MNTIHHLSQYASQELIDIYSEREIRSICNMIYTDILHFTNIDIHLKKNEILEKSFINKFTEIVGLLKSGRPIQYILGETEFAGLRLEVNGSTLIPRPETRELVEWVKESLTAGQSVLDIGTGSGCIAVTLARRCPDCSMTGMDISTEAITTAQRNAARHEVDVNWLVGDILQYERESWEDYDVIVSNPPYVRESEKAEMEERVLRFEPSRALFVPDQDPLLFYRKICAFGQQHLKANGLLFFEINEAFGPQMLELMEQYGYIALELRKDFFGKERMIKGQKTTRP